MPKACHEWMCEKCGKKYEEHIDAVQCENRHAACNRITITDVKYSADDDYSYPTELYITTTNNASIKYIRA